jgi:hypothetical protein
MYKSPIHIYIYQIQMWINSQQVITEALWIDPSTNIKVLLMWEKLYLIQGALLAEV